MTKKDESAPAPISKSGPPAVSVKRPTPVRRQSGQLPAVEAARAEYRKRLESIDERTMPALLEADKRLGEEITYSSSPPASQPLASDWCITIYGRGPHHNGTLVDADKIATRLLRVLIEAGHSVVSAKFRNGIEEDLEKETPP